MTAEGSSLLGFENERCQISTTSYNLTVKPPARRKDNSSVTKILILIVSLLVVFILIGFIARQLSSSSHETNDDMKQVVAAGIVGYIGRVSTSPPSMNISSPSHKVCSVSLPSLNISSPSLRVSQLLTCEPTYKRILDQYGFQVADTKKLILMWSDWPNILCSKYDKVLGKKFCKYTCDRNMINISDAVVFRDVSSDDEIPDRSNSKQIWIFNHRKPDSFNFTKHKSSFNWTATHRFDSNVPHPYDYLWPFRNQSNITDTQLVAKYIQSKYKNNDKNSRVKVAVFADCNNTELRKYTDDLGQYINLDRYCSREILNRNKTFDPPIQQVSKWFKKYKETYIFYLALEEQQCAYYITNQFFGALRSDLIPIVKGNIDVYKKLAPHDSYIHIDSFNNMEDMAQYLDDLNVHREKLAKYLRWKETTKLTNVYWYTQICNLIQGISGEETFTIDNINNEISMC